MVFFCGFLSIRHKPPPLPPVFKLFSARLDAASGINRHQPMLILQHRLLNEPVRRISATRGDKYGNKRRNFNN